MISQKCPKCLSKRVRRGYRRTPFLMKILFRYHLLCDNCNWEFTGFAVPGTVTSRSKRHNKSGGLTNRIGKTDEKSIKSKPESGQNPIKANKVKKKVKIKF